MNHTSKSDIAVIAPEIQCELAENPLWDHAAQRLFWTDIPAGKIYDWNLATEQAEAIYQGTPVGGFTLQRDGSLLLFRKDDVARLVPGQPAVPLFSYQDAGMARFNDVIADPAGRVFAGTIGRTAESGGLYRVERGGKVRQLFAGSGCANGMGFSPEGKTFYWTCSSTRRIFRFDYDVATGELSGRTLFYEAPAAAGIPDGLTVDAQGSVWSARWGGYGFCRHGANGEVLETIPLPARNVTSLCFGGKNGDELFVTTAQEEGEVFEGAGRIYRVKMQVRGGVEFRTDF